MRLNKYIASTGLYSRRKADDLIKNSKVTINNEIITDLSYQVDLNKNLQIFANGQEIKPANNKTYLILNKPTDYTCTKKIFKNEKNIFELIPKEFHNLNYAGRLDKDSTGLILLTNDGDFIQKLTHPTLSSKKIYEILLSGYLDRKKIQQFETGIELDGILTKPAKLKIIEEFNNRSVLRVSIEEGRKRQIRRMFLCLGNKVLGLHRVQIANIKLPNNLEIGDWKLINI